MNIFGYILIIFTIVLTVFIGIKQPKMHTKIFVYNSDYEIVDENQTPPAETVTKTEELPTMPVENTQSKVQIILQEQENPVVNVEVKTVEQPKTTTQTKQNKTEVQKKPSTTTTTKQVPKTTTNVKPAETKITQDKQTKPQTTTVQTQTKTPVTQTQTKAPATQTVTKTVPAQTTVKVLTQQEEEIAWNTWHSNLQNRIMKDSKLPVMPMGTVFKVSFDVDKYGKITNLQTWSPDSRYTPYAIEFIAPVIKSYQGKSILNFPEGSQRTKTTFNGGWRIASTQKYSTPNDYNDTERVVK